MARYRISYGLGGGFNVHETDEVEANNVDQATEYAYIAATELFEFYGVFANQNPDYDESSEDYEQDYQEELERWIDYSAELV